jgi:PAS domain S-box-containing protein
MEPTLVSADESLRKFIPGLPAVLYSLPQPVLIVDRGLRIRYANDYACRAFGYSRGQLLRSDMGLIVKAEELPALGEVVADLAGSSGGSAPKSRVQMLEVVNRSGVKINVNATTVQIVSDTGEVHVFVRFDDAYLNLSRQQLATLQLGTATTSQDVLSALGSLEYPIVVLDRKWRFVFLNNSAWRDMGRDEHEVMGQVIWELSPHLVGTKWHKAAYRAMESGKRVRVEEYYPHRDAWFESKFYPSQETLVTMMKDVTEERKIRAMNEQLIDTLEKAMGTVGKRERRRV